ncbi:MAG: Gfo/Idh/MocA family oxidoreductase [Candidatus Methylomirabilis sp.]|nr:Gfo/Idh/MocA family oxidoreductase [Deltaproteobacteria bacterium]
MRALVAGFGSAGKRHLSNLLELEGMEGVTVLTSRWSGEWSGPPNVKFIGSIDEVGKRGAPSGADFAILANETGKHLETAVALAKRGIDLFIEKPLSHSLEGVESLVSAVRESGVRVFIAYNMRFMGAIRRLKAELKMGAVGAPYFARIEAGQFLPYWRPGSDYRKGYSASRERGGGVHLDLSHELDYMRFLFGDPLSWKTARAGVSSLEIDSEDVFEGIYHYEGGFICSVHLDYLQRRKTRRIIVVGSLGRLECDLVEGRIVLESRGKTERIDDENLFGLDGTYKDELAYFLGALRRGEDPEPGLHDGIAVLRLLEDSGVRQ